MQLLVKCLFYNSILQLKNIIVYSCLFQYRCFEKITQLVYVVYKNQLVKETYENLYVYGPFDFRRQSSPHDHYTRVYSSCHIVCHRIIFMKVLSLSFHHVGISGWGTKSDGPEPPNLKVLFSCIYLYQKKKKRLILICRRQ